MLYIGLFREKHEKIFLSETTRPRAMTFVMKHYLVVFYPVWSNYSPGAKMAPSRGSHALHRLNREKHEIVLSETIRPRALIFGM